ncbi:GNAT family N-acetyltransferase [Massilia sp. CCM 8695]|uniref:GNAT family N-acetyltransferase n=1 Tax=Massilia frigida TaxID=2609281 RepID=A0ABX0NDJ5_9BURK|nr:GNAT family N-acetyltransferase [Massilia frigida]
MVCDPDKVAAGFAVTVRSDLKGHGLGQVLMAKLIACCRSRSCGARAIMGEALPQNTRITKLARKLGFEICKAAADGSVHMRLPL